MKEVKQIKTVSIVFVAHLNEVHANQRALLIFLWISVFSSSSVDLFHLCDIPRQTFVDWKRIININLVQLQKLKPKRPSN